MVNKRFLELAERQRNPSLPAERIQEQTPQTNTNFSINIDNAFIFSYDGPNGNFAQELIAKSNERFKGTEAEIPTGSSGEIQGHLIKRLGLITTIYNNPQLRSANLYPITPAQSEALLRNGQLTNPKENWEDLGMILYDRSQEGENPREAQVIYDSLKAHRQDLSLNQSDLENRLIIVNAGAEVDSSMPHGVKPIVLPGLTQVYQHEVLEEVGKNTSFDGYGLNDGLPLLYQLGRGDRTLCMPDKTENIGLCALYRDEDLDLDAMYRNLANSGNNGRVNFASQGSAP